MLGNHLRTLLRLCGDVDSPSLPLSACALLPLNLGVGWTGSRKSRSFKDNRESAHSRTRDSQNARSRDSYTLIQDA